MEAKIALLLQIKFTHWRANNLQCYWQGSKLNHALEEVSCYACFRS